MILNWRQRTFPRLLLAFICVLNSPACAGDSPAAAIAAETCPAQFTRFVPDPTTPVFTAGAAGAWDAKIRERGWILKEGETWHLWYTGYEGTRTGIRRLGYASSRDGKTWTRATDNPVYREHWVEDMMVVLHKGTFYMFAEGLNDHAQLLTSKDGRHWERQGTLDIRYTDGRKLTPGPFGTPVAWCEGETWYLLYERSDKGVWLASSRDLKVWTHVQDEPVMQPGPAEFEEEMIAVNQVLRKDGVYYAIYHGRGKASAARPKPPWSTAVAVSRDRIHWQKCAENPIFPPAENKSSGIFVWDGERYLLYTMHDQVVRHVPAKGAGLNSSRPQNPPTGGIPP